MKKAFRITAYLEGISFLVLLGFAMPMKYVYGNPAYVKAMGWVHGLLFIAYVALLDGVASMVNWPTKKTATGFLAGVLPFGTFFFERSIKEFLIDK